MLNGFCQLSKNPPLPWSYKHDQAGDGIPAKIKWKLHASFTLYFGLEGISYKNLQDTATSSFISFCFTLSFTSTDIIFHNLLELDSTLSEKRFLSRFFRFFMDSLKPPPLNGQNPLTMTDVFLLMLLIRSKLFERIYINL